MKKLFLLTALILGTVNPAFSLPEGCRLLESKILESKLNVVELRDSRRVAFNGEHKGFLAGLKAGWKSRHHFYQIFGPKEYVYITKDRDQIVTEIYDKSVPDRRSSQKQHPLWDLLGHGSMVAGAGANTAGFFK